MLPKMSDGKYKLMLVDDDASVRESLCKLLETEGYRVIPASTGAEAAAAFRQKQRHIDLLLVDLNLPIKNGWVLVNQALEINPDLPVFIITALSHQRELAEAAGASALVEKPVDVPELLRLVRQRLAGPIEPPVLAACHPKFPFCYVHSPRYASPNSRMLDDIAPQSHWGLNE